MIVSHETKIKSLIKEAFSPYFMLDDKKIEAFYLYLTLLREWNRYMNLTRVYDDKDVIYRHFLESAFLLLVDTFATKSLIDIGSGAGFPGIPVAIVSGKKDIYLLERDKKKSSFLRFVVSSLGLGLQVINLDLKELRKSFDAAVFRAVAFNDKFLKQVKAILNPEGMIYVYLSKSQFSEIALYDYKHFSYLDRELFIGRLK